LVQKNLDVGQQSEFFRSLPTTEWEDAGDWFLDQFQNIVQRIRQARQKKRKLAQDFEAEVEKRYEHVSKRQNQVQHAMDRMKEQGEGLVPRSPKPSKSPRPKRG
jgi:DNA-binding protein H-NS